MKKRSEKKRTKILVGSVLLGMSAASMAGGTIKLGDNQSISVGMGLRTAFTAMENGAPSGSAYSKDFAIQNARIYLSGQVNDSFKFTFNTDEIFGHMGVLDAIIQYEPSPAFNVWMGRMLTPADRIEMNGPFYGLSWNQYTVPLLPSDQLGAAGLYGRDDGLTVWGNIAKFQYAVGAFDGYSGPANADDNLLFAARFAYNFLNMEKNPAYYTSSTYYGGLGDIFTVAVSAQHQSDGAGIAGDSADFDAAVVDVLLEKVLGNGDVLNVEGEFKVMNNNLSATALADKDVFALFDGTAYFATVAYLVSKPVGKGKLQPYVRYTKNEPSSAAIGSSDLTEMGVNYVISGHNLRMNFNVTSGDANLTGAPGKDATGISFGMQQQF